MLPRQLVQSLLMRQRPKLTDLLSDSKLSIAFIFDFDGTLADISEDPSSVTVPDELIQKLEWLQLQTGGAVVILSGRPIAFLKDIFGQTEIGLAGEHGTDSNFFSLERTPQLDKVPTPAVDYLQVLTEKHPQSFIEEKRVSLVWHYRKARQEVSEQQAKEYQRQLSEILRTTDYRCEHYTCVLEIKSANISKCEYVKGLMRGPFSERRIVAFGDDFPEEELFQAIKPGGISFAVGDKIRNADFKFATPQELRTWLMQTCE